MSKQKKFETQQKSRADHCTKFEMVKSLLKMICCLQKGMVLSAAPSQCRQGRKDLAGVMQGRTESDFE